MLVINQMITFPLTRANYRRASYSCPLSSFLVKLTRVVVYGPHSCATFLGITMTPFVLFHVNTTRNGACTLCSQCSEWNHPAVTFGFLSLQALLCHGYFHMVVKLVVLVIYDVTRNCFWRQGTCTYFLWFVLLKKQQLATDCNSLCGIYNTWNDGGDGQSIG